jgi:hypothetical protein
MIGARGYGFGGAYVAVVNDIGAAYWNPAGLGRVKSMSLMESNWILQEVEGLNVNYAAFGLPLKPVGTIAVGWLLRHAMLEEGPDAERNGANENTFSLAAGRTILRDVLFLEELALGLSINRHWFTTADPDGDAAGFGFDAGVLARFPYGLSLGFVARALGADVAGENVDPELRLGVGWSRLFADMHRVTVDIDGAYKRHRDYLDEETLEPAENNLKYYGGLEYAILLGEVEMALRGGANGLLYNTAESYGYACGIGVKYLGYSIQYAFKGDTERDRGLGFGHRVSLILELDRLWRKQNRSEGASKEAGSGGGE